MLKCIITGCGKPLTKNNRAFNLEEIRENPFHAICNECANKYPVHYSYNGHVVTDIKEFKCNNLKERI